jgi:nicotinamide-nucleotide amidase
VFDTLNLVNAEIIAVGSEMLTPAKIDTNSLFLTAKLNELGVELQTKSIVGDVPGLLTDSVKLALQRSEIVIVTGGLGPTEDDLTRESVAEALGVGLHRQDEIYLAIEERFRKLGRKITENNRKQADVINGATVLPNPNGTAPGQWLEFAPGKAVMLLPGPPRELEPLFMAECYSRLRTMLPPMAIATLFWRISGLGESQVDALVAPIYKRYTNPVTTILSSLGDIQLHLRAHAATEAEAEAILVPIAEEMAPLLGEHLYSRRGQTLEEVVGELLVSRQETIAVAESCTGGLVGARLSEVAGSSRYFLGGFLTYSDAMKRDLLCVSAELLEEHSAVSEASAKAMAVGAKAKTRASWGVSVTGLAGPDGGNELQPVGTVWIGIAGPDGECKAVKYQFPGDRNRVRTFAGQYALLQIYHHLRV